jgi:hypothetical protein
MSGVGSVVVLPAASLPARARTRGAHQTPLLSGVGEKLSSSKKKKQYMDTRCWIEMKTIYLQVTPPCSFTPDEIKYLTNRIQNSGTEVVDGIRVFSVTTTSHTHTQKEI